MRRFALPFFAFFVLNSCQTLDGIGGDLSSAWNASADALTRITARDVTGNNAAAASAASGPAQPIACPPVRVMEELRNLVEFQDPAKPSDKTEMARAMIKTVDARCAVGGNLSVELDITIDSTLGPKARVKKTDKPNFAFPYFIAVISPEGGVVAKEIFAASLSFENGEDKMNRMETITQHIPLSADGTVPAYSILVGFQLSEEQLAFNRTQPILNQPVLSAP